MGLILDTTILIARERRGDSIADMLRDVPEPCVGVAISVVSVVELSHGIQRARTDRQRDSRTSFANSVFRSLAVYPVTLEIAQLAGATEGAQAAKSVATALHLGYAVATLNVKHFQPIPDLMIISL